MNLLSYVIATISIGTAMVMGTGTDTTTLAERSVVAQEIFAVVKEMDQPSVSYYIDAAKKESALNPKARNRYSSSKGLYQFIDSTWYDIVDRYGKQYDLTRDGRDNIRQSVTGMVLHTLENKEYMEAELGREVTNKELYLAHFAGKHKALKLMHADKTIPVSKVLGNKAVNANPHIKGLTVGQAIKKLTEGIRNE